MRRLLASLCAVLFVFFVGVCCVGSSVKAQGTSPININCGYDGEQCCPINSASNLPRPAGIFRIALEAIPGVGDAIKAYDNYVNEINSFSTTYSKACHSNTIPIGDVNDPNNCVCEDIGNSSGQVVLTLAGLCDTNFDSARWPSRPPGTTSNVSQATLDEERDNCLRCASQERYYSGFGCIPIDMSDFISDYVFKYGLGIAGGIALLCIILSAIQMQTSRGDTEKLKKARENITSCLIGLILIIFSVFIINFFGKNVLGIFP